MFGSTMALVRAHDCMQYNAIGEGGARELARALKINGCITHLNVGVRWWKEPRVEYVVQDGTCEH